jgi:hypothetical protein
MANKSDILRIVKSMGIESQRAETIYGLSDGHIYLNGDAKAIAKIASENELEIFAIKGPEIKLKTKEKDATSGS